MFHYTPVLNGNKFKHKTCKLASRESFIMTTGGVRRLPPGTIYNMVKIRDGLSELKYINKTYL